MKASFSTEVTRMNWLRILVTAGLKYAAFIEICLSGVGRAIWGEQLYSKPGTREKLPTNPPVEEIRRKTHSLCEP